MRNNNDPAGGCDPLVYQCRLPLSTATLRFLAQTLRAHLKKINSRWRKLPPARIAVIVLAALRCDQRLADLAGAHAVSRTTVDRWLKETLTLLAAKAERLQRALRKIVRKGGCLVLIDGTLVRTRRRSGREKKSFYSGKHKCHGLLIIGLVDTRGRLLWVSAARPGRASEITTCRHNKITERLREAGLGAIADLGFAGLDDQPQGNPTIICGYKAAKNRPVTTAQKQVNKLLAAERAVCEHAFAHLKNWRILTRLRMDPKWATPLLRALMVLTHQEVNR